MEIVRLSIMTECDVCRVLFYDRGSEVSREGDSNIEGGGREIGERMD